MKCHAAISAIAALVVFVSGCSGSVAVSDQDSTIAIASAAELNGKAGKVFDFSPDDTSFRFLMQDVKYDEETGVGTAWYKAHVTDETVFTQRQGRRNFSGIRGPVVAIFTGMDEANTKAMAEGKLFRAKNVVLRPDLKKVTGVSEDGQTIVGWFVPREARFSRDGMLKLNGKDVPAGVAQGGIRIHIEQKRTREDVSSGFWRATLKGDSDGSKFVVSRMLLEPLKNPLQTDNPKLPRVLSVGDSISMNYENAARDALKGVANYHRIEDNCWSVHRGVAFMAYWLGDYHREGLGWDVIHFNSGLHDMKQEKLGGDYAVSLDVYKQKLKQEIELMKKTGATLVFCTTTPVPNDSGSARYAFRTKGAEKDFNKAALEVLKDYPDIIVNDLAGFINGSSAFDKWRKGRDVHYWKKEEQAAVGKAVAEVIAKALKSRTGN